MSITERNRERRRIGWRTTMDLIMGIAYITVGSVIIWYNSMGGFDFPPLIAYVLGAMMVIGGGARFYRGCKAVTGSQPGAGPDEGEAPGKKTFPPGSIKDD